MAAVSGVLLIIIMSGRFIKYMAQAAQGLLEPGVLFLIMGYRIPGFLQLILPLGLFLGILLAYGRMYLDSEIVVLNAAGFSQQRLFANTLLPALLIAIFSGFLSFYLTPTGMAKVEEIFRQQDALTEFDTLSPGRFQAMKDGQRVTYAAALDNNQELLRGVFISEAGIERPGKPVVQGKSLRNSDDISVLLAKRGQQVVQKDGNKYLVLEDGYRYDGRPGEADYRVVRYETYAILLPKPSEALGGSDREAMTTAELWQGKHVRLKTELHWRMSIPVLAFVVTMFAVPLARVNPRQGRFLKLLPAIFLYMAYLTLLIASRDALDKGKIPVQLGMWPVHLLFFVIGVVLMYWQGLLLRWERRQVKNSNASLEAGHA